MKEKEPEIKGKDLLTHQEITFCDCIVAGMSRRDAYKKAYPGRAHWSTTTLDPEISKLYNNPRTTQLLAQKQDEYDKIHFMSKEYKRAELKSVWEDTNNSLKDRLNALKLDAQLSGHLAPTKVEQTGNMNLNHSVAPEISTALDKIFG